MAKSAKQARVFEVGDIVRVVKAGRCKDRFGKVDDIDIESDDRPFLVTWLTSYSGAWFNEADLAPAGLAEAAILPSAI